MTTPVTSVLPRKRVVFVPAWIFRNLRSRGVSLDVLVDSQALPTHLSPRDIAQVEILNQQIQKYLIGAIGFGEQDNRLLDMGQFPEPEFLYNLIARSVHLPQQATLYQTTVKELVGVPDLALEVSQRLASVPDNYIADAHATACTVLDNIHGVFFVVLHEGYWSTVVSPDQDGVATQIKVVKDTLCEMLRVFHMYYRQHEVARSIWFARYLCLLSKLV